MAIATRTPTRPSKLTIWERKLSKSAFRPQLNAELRCNQLALAAWSSPTAICHSDQSGGISLRIDFPFLASLADNDPAAAGVFARHDKYHICKELYFAGADLYR